MKGGAFIKKYVYILLLLLLLLLSALFYKQTGIAVNNAINTCLTVIIPSMYGFLIVSTLIVKSDAYVILGRPFGFMSEKLFHVPQNLFSVYLLSSVSGYPVGAKLLSELENKGKITKKQYENMLCYCYSGGFSFIVGTVGARLYSDIRIGLIIFSSITLSNLIIAFFMRKSMGKPVSCKENVKITINSDIIISSIQSAARAIFQMCIIITAFSFLFSIIESCVGERLSSSDSYSRCIIAALFEISRIIDLSGENYSYIPLLCFLLSFGGICVIMQIIGIGEGRVNILKFVLIRLAAAAISSLISLGFVYILFFKSCLPVFAPMQARLTEYSIIPSIFMIIMTILLFLKKDWTK